MTIVAAVDCGATSVRVCRIDLDAPGLVPEVVHRVPHAPVADAAGHLRWDWQLITRAVEEGLERCLALGPLASIGIDTWAVDYALLDSHGTLLAEPVAYRDGRTASAISRVDTLVSRREQFEINGLQHLPFATLYQLEAEKSSDVWEQARHIVLLPDLLSYWLTGHLATERTNAGMSKP